MTHPHTPDEKKVLAELADTAEGIMEQVEVMTAAPEPEVHKLDEFDSLRLENMMLKNQAASLSAALAEKQAKENQDAFQAYLVNKFDIDVATQQLHVDPTKNTVTIVSR